MEIQSVSYKTARIDQSGMVDLIRKAVKNKSAEVNFNYDDETGDLSHIDVSWEHVPTKRPRKPKDQS